MNEKEIKVALDQLTAISEFALQLKENLAGLLDKDTAEVSEPQKFNKKEKAAEKAEEKPVDLDAIIEEQELKSMKIGEIREFLDGYKVDYPEKAKKPELIQILAQAIADGVIPLEGDEDEPVDEDNEDTEDKVDDDDEEVDFEPSQERLDVEEEVEQNIMSGISKKKLKMSAIKKFLKAYYDGDAEFADLSDHEDDDLIDMYVEIQKALVDDDGEVHAMEQSYYRDGEIYCCGRPVVEMEDSDNLYCEICGNEYGDDEEE